MVIVEECCCGCSLRTGTLILLWLSVITGVYSVMKELMKLSNFNEEDYEKRGADSATIQLYKIHLVISIISDVAAFITAIFGINAIQKNKPKYLTPFLYYFGFAMIYGGLFTLVALFHPKLFLCILSPETVEQFKEYALGGTITLLIGLGLTAYFFVVIKSCRDSMLENAARNNVNAAPQAYAPPPYCDKA